MALHSNVLAAALLSSSEHLPAWTLLCLGSSGVTSPHLEFAGGSLWQLSCLKVQGRAAPGSVLEHPLLEFTQCVPENGAVALGLDFNDLLVSNQNNLVGLMVCLLTGQGPCSGFQLTEAL